MTFQITFGSTVMAMGVTVTLMKMMKKQQFPSRIPRLRRYQQLLPKLPLRPNPRTTKSKVPIIWLICYLMCLRRLFEDGSESVSSDIFVMCPEHPALGTDESSDVLSMGEAGSATSGETTVQESLGDKTLASHTAVGRSRSLGSRHVLVKDTAFQT